MAKASGYAYPMTLSITEVQMIAVTTPMRGLAAKFPEIRLKVKQDGKYEWIRLEDFYRLMGPAWHDAKAIREPLRTEIELAGSFISRCRDLGVAIDWDNDRINRQKYKIGLFELPVNGELEDMIPPYFKYICIRLADLILPSTPLSREQRNPDPEQGGLFDG